MDKKRDMGNFWTTNKICILVAFLMINSMEQENTFMEENFCMKVHGFRDKLLVKGNYINKK